MTLQHSCSSKDWVPTLDIKKDPNQLTFYIPFNLLPIARHLLFKRYVCGVGQISDFHVDWLDQASNPIRRLDVHDSSDVFVKSGKLPSELFSTKVQINFGSQKLVTVTLFYTTANILVQGNKCPNWRDQEFYFLVACLQKFSPQDTGHLQEDVFCDLSSLTLPPTSVSKTGSLTLKDIEPQQTPSVQQQQRKKKERSSRRLQLLSPDMPTAIEQNNDRLSSPPAILPLIPSPDRTDLSPQVQSSVSDPPELEQDIDKLPSAPKTLPACPTIPTPNLTGSSPKVQSSVTDGTATQLITSFGQDNQEPSSTPTSLIAYPPNPSPLIPEPVVTEPQSCMGDDVASKLEIMPVNDCSDSRDTPSPPHPSTPHDSPLPIDDDDYVDEDDVVTKQPKRRRKCHRKRTNCHKSHPFSIKAIKKQLRYLHCHLSRIALVSRKAPDFVTCLMEDTKQQVKSDLKQHVRVQIDRLTSKIDTLDKEVHVLRKANSDLKSQIGDLKKERGATKIAVDAAVQTKFHPVGQGEEPRLSYKIPTANKYEALELNAEDTNENEAAVKIRDSQLTIVRPISEAKLSVNKKNISSPPSPRERLADFKVTPGTTHLLIGDSVLRPVKPDLMFPSRRTLKISVSGLTVDDVCHWLKYSPKSPDVRHVVFHVGVNTCTMNTVTESAWRGLMTLLRTVFPNCFLYASSIVPPRGDHPLKRTIAVSNCALEEVCSSDEVIFIDHTATFITSTGAPCKDLYRDSLHPNPKGTARLACNIKRAGQTRPTRHHPQAPHHLRDPVPLHSTTTPLHSTTQPIRRTFQREANQATVTPPGPPSPFTGRLWMEHRPQRQPPIPLSCPQQGRPHFDPRTVPWPLRSDLESRRTMQRPFMLPTPYGYLPSQFRYPAASRPQLVDPFRNIPLPFNPYTRPHL